MRALGEDRVKVPPRRRPDDPLPRASERQHEIEAELVQQLVRQAPTGFAIGTLTVAGVSLVLWSAAPRDLLLVWLLSMGLLTLPAFFVVWRFTRTPHVAESLASWRRALTVAFGLAGTGWATAWILLYP